VPGIVKLLIGRGADVNAVGADGMNALERLLKSDGYWHSGHDQVVEILREAGARENPVGG